MGNSMVRFQEIEFLTGFKVFAFPATVETGFATADPDFTRRISSTQAATGFTAQSDHSPQNFIALGVAFKVGEKGITGKCLRGDVKSRGAQFRSQIPRQIRDFAFISKAVSAVEAAIGDEFFRFGQFILSTDSLDLLPQWKSCGRCSEKSPAPLRLQRRRG